MTQLSRQLRVFLEKRNISAAELSRQSGVPKQTLSEWLSGRTPRNLDQVCKVCEALRVPIVDLLIPRGESRNEIQLLPPSRNEALVHAYLATAKLLSKPPCDIRSDDDDQSLLSDTARFFLQQSTDILSVRKLGGFSTHYSPSLTKILGWTPQELKGNIALVLVAPEEREKIALSIVEHIRAGIFTWEIRHAALHKDGRRIEMVTTFNIDPTQELLMTDCKLPSDAFDDQFGKSRAQQFNNLSLLHK